MRIGSVTRGRTRRAGAVMAALAVAASLMVACGEAPVLDAAGRVGPSTAPTTTDTAIAVPPLTIAPSTLPPTTVPGSGDTGGTGGTGGSGGTGGTGGSGEGGTGGSYTLGSATISRSTFGMHVNQVSASAWPTIPIGAFRIWNTDSTWGAVEPSPGQWSFTRLDARVAAARARGASVLLVLGMPPAWAASHPDQKGYGGSPSVPKDMGQWSAYVRAVAARYKGRIEAYEIWNEPNLPQFFTGTPAQLGELTRVAAQAIRSVDGSAKVVSSGFSARTGGASGYFSAYVSSGIRDSIDAVGIHVYPYPPNGPESMVGLAQQFRAIANSAGLGSKPMWNTEIGYGRTPGALIGETAAASLILRTYLVLPAAGLVRNYWYMWDDRGFVGLYLVGPDRKSPTAAAYRFATAEKLLVGATVRGCRSSGSLWSCDVTLGSGQAVSIAWSTSGTRTYTVPSATTIAYTFGGGHEAASAGSSHSVGLTPIIFAPGAVAGL